MEKLTRLYSL